MNRPIFLIVALSCLTAAAHAEPRDAQTVDTEHLFGFVEGSDIGERGEREIMVDTTARAGKGGGTYRAVATTLEAKTTVRDDFRLSAAATLSTHNIANVPGLDDRNRTTLQQLSFGARYRALDRAQSPFGLTFGIEPHWGFADEASGAPASRQGIGFLVSADREFVPGRVIGALNFVYEPEQARLNGSSATTRESTASFGGALAMLAAPGIYLGAETRYLRRYEGFALNSFAGQALYAGPTIYARLGGTWWLSAAWNIQAWGSTEGSSSLDVANFERHQIKFRLGTNF